MPTRALAREPCSYPEAQHHALCYGVQGNAQKKRKFYTHLDTPIDRIRLGGIAQKDACMFRWSWYVGTIVGAVLSVFFVILQVLDTEVQALWSPVILGVIFGGLLGSLYGIRAQINPSHVPDVRRDFLLNILIGIVAGTFIGSVVATNSSLQFTGVYKVLFEVFGRVAVVCTIVGAIIGLVIGAIINRPPPAPPVGQ
jgi:MFS family permease